VYQYKKACHLLKNSLWRQKNTGKWPSQWKKNKLSLQYLNLVLLFTFVCLFVSVCPTGFTWLSQQGCVAILQQPATKSVAVEQCKDLNPKSNLMMPKNEWHQMKLEQFAKIYNVTNTSFFIGLTQTDGYWYWDDGTSVFVKCKNQQYLLQLLLISVFNP
jgi:hypothetical protein